MSKLVGLKLHALNGHSKYTVIEYVTFGADVFTVNMWPYYTYNMHGHNKYKALTKCGHSYITQTHKKISSHK